MGWENLQADLAEEFAQDIWGAQLQYTVDDRLRLYERIRKYLASPKGKDALKRYQAKPEVQQRRQFLEKLRRAADPERYRAYRRKSDAKRQADPIKREKMLAARRARERLAREAKVADTVNSGNGG